MPTPSIQTLRADAQQVLNLDSISAVRSVVAATLANANAGTPLNPNLTTQQLWNEFYQIVTQPKSDIESIIANQLMKFLFAPPAPGGAGANQQVIFNDGGVLAGDPQFLWNKTTNLLTVTGSATITGDLTVDTSTLKVDSANNRVGIGTASPALPFAVSNAGAQGFEINPNGSIVSGGIDILSYNRSTSLYKGIGFGAESYLFRVGTVSVSDAMTLNSTGLGVGMSPSAILSVLKSSATQATGLILRNASGADGCSISLDFEASAGTSGSEGSLAGRISGRRVGGGTTGALDFFVTNAGTLGSAKMVLDASGNLLVGIASGTQHTLLKGTTVNEYILNVTGLNNACASFYSGDTTAFNAANTCLKIASVAATGRSINASGTVNASGADYAEYMTKASDFVLAKGDVAGIDANGKLTNVFADAVSFVVKSTDPSYVGNDNWGADLEGADLEAARQLVDRIAFAGQVPVNVTGAKAGDYIVPIVSGTGIKGQAVSNPTFEQYQLAVGKVISIEADGRARIIVKVA